MFFSSLLSGIPNGDFNKLAVNNANISSKIETPNVKKRHRRAKSGGLKSTDPSQGDGMYTVTFTKASAFCVRPGSEVIKLISCSIQVSIKF